METGQLRPMPTVSLVLLLSISVVWGQTDSSKVKNPRMAGYMGLAFPGGGQIYNERYFKAGAIITLEVMSYLAFQQNRKNYNHYDERNLPLSRHRYLEKRNKYAWWMGLLYIYGILDAIVDAHLHRFDAIMEEDLDVNQPGKEATL